MNQLKLNDYGRIYNNKTKRGWRYFNKNRKPKIKRIKSSKKKYRFYSEDDIKLEYDSFKKGKGVFPERLFPRDKIKSYDDFKRYWSPKKLGVVFVPEIGMLTFDCYFGRTSKRAMHNIARYLLMNIDKIESVSGSYSTFVERCGYSEKKQKILLTLIS